MSNRDRATHILLVDTDNDLMSRVQPYLADYGYQVMQADSVLQALQLVRTQTPAVIFSDLELKDGSGIDLLIGLNKLDIQTPVIMLAPEAQMSSVLSALRYGAFDYISKPLPDLSVLLYAAKAAVASEPDETKRKDELEMAMNELRYNREALMQDAKMASLFQASLLPEQQVTSGELELHWRMPLRPKPSRYFLDVFNLSEQFTSFYIADFGKEPVEAAFSSGVLKVVFNEAIRELEREGSTLLHAPSGVVDKAGYYLKSLELKSVPSLVYGVLDTQLCKLTWASANFNKGPYLWLNSATQLLADSGPSFNQSDDAYYESNEFSIEKSMPLVFSHMDGEQVLLLAEKNASTPNGMSEQELLCQPTEKEDECQDLFSLVIKRKG